mmetsp:Transcript_23679/g.55234  ORF Transcript_23679/g.55234 Transcript_23679/m.55234 type:complete len:488 (+) Transcript_23679:89-1552(+)
MPGAQQQVSYDEIAEKIGIGRFHWRLLLLCGLGFAACAMEISLAGFLMNEIRASWDVGEVQLGIMNTVTSALAIAGEWFFGPLADTVGRRGVFIASVVLGMCGGLASAFAWNIHSLVLLRAIATFGLGGNIVVDLALFSEFLPTSSRGNMIFLLAAFWPVGQLSCCLLAWVVIPSLGWRVFLAAAAIPSFLAACFRPFMPESPRWLLTQGRAEEATEILVEIASECRVDPQDVGLRKGTIVSLGIAEMDDTAKAAARPVQTCCTNVARLFHPALSRTTCGIILYVCALEIGSYAVGTLMPTLLVNKGIGGVGVYLGMTLNSLSLVPGMLSVILLGMYAVGRLRSMQIFLPGFAAALAIFGRVNGAQGTILLSCVSSSFLQGCWSLFHVYVPEVYPTQLRGTACGALSSFGALMGLAAPVSMSVLLTHYGATVAINSVVATCAALGVLSTFFMLQVETMGRDLHDLALQENGSSPDALLHKEPRYGAV